MIAKSIFRGIKLALLGLLLCQATLSPASEADTAPELIAARKTAAAEKKDILILFTGPTWCGPCEALEKNVFSQVTFQTDVAKQFVVLRSEYRKFGASKDDRDNDLAHFRLARPFKVNAYPTIILADEKGNPYFTHMGYRDQKPNELLEKFVAAKSARGLLSELLAELTQADAEKNPVTRKARILDIEKKIPRGSINPILAPALWKLSDLDADNSLDIRKRYRLTAAVVELSGLNGGNPDRVLALTQILVDEYGSVLAQDKKLGVAVLRIRARVQYNRADFKAALKTLRDLKTIDPDPDACQKDIDYVEKLADSVK